MKIATNSAEFRQAIADHKRIFILHDERFSAENTRDWLPTNSVCIGQLGFAGGETSKSLDSLARVWQALLAAGADRSTLLLVIGGGSLTDLGGMAASTFKRGIPVAHVPTTVVAMVDAAIGGKTGLNFNGIKNQVGTYHMPCALGLAPEWLQTLPARERLSGWMEMVKHAYLAGESDVAQVWAVTDLDQIPPLIAPSAAIKLQYIARDPHESGPRKALNLGHTVGHAIESACAPLPHGIAIGFGLAFALIGSVDQRVGLDEFACKEAVAHLKHALREERFPQVSPEELWSIMQFDKKNEAGRVMEVWLKGWGEPVWDQPLELEDFHRIWLKTAREFTGGPA